MALRLRTAILITVLLAAFAPRAYADIVTPEYSAYQPLHYFGSSSAVAVNGDIFVFGEEIVGCPCYPVNAIHRYDTPTATFENLSASFPPGISIVGMSAVTDGTSVYLLGGESGTILRFDPTTLTVDVLPGQLPGRLTRMSLVWGGDAIYTFYGFDLDCAVNTTQYAECLRNDIHRYDPSSGIVTTLPMTLPWYRQYSTAIWTGSDALIFGGDQNSIVRVDPSQETVEELEIELPVALSRASAFWDGSNAYLYGGVAVSTTYVPNHAIFRFTPADDSLVTMSANTSAIFFTVTSGAFDGQSTYMFGSDGLLGTNVVGRYVLVPGTPQMPDAHHPISALTSNLFTWDAPANNTYSANQNPVTSYRVYRAVDDNDFAVFANTTSDEEWVEDDACFIGSVCRYKVSALNALGEGEMSGAARIRGTALPIIP